MIVPRAGELLAIASRAQRAMTATSFMRIGSGRGMRTPHSQATVIT